MNALEPRPEGWDFRTDPKGWIAMAGSTLAFAGLVAYEVRKSKQVKVPIKVMH